MGRERENLEIRVVQMGNLRAMMGVKRIDRMRNESIRELIGAHKGLDEVTNEMEWI